MRVRSTQSTQSVLQSTGLATDWCVWRRCLKPSTARIVSPSSTFASHYSLRYPDLEPTLYRIHVTDSLPKPTPQSDALVAVSESATKTPPLCQIVPSAQTSRDMQGIVRSLPCLRCLLHTQVVLAALHPHRHSSNGRVVSRTSVIRLVDTRECNHFVELLQSQRNVKESTFVVYVGRELRDH